MELWEVLVTILGLALMAAALLDVCSAVLHVDSNGMIGVRVQNAIWRLLVGCSRRLPQSRRSLLALAGPAMVLATSFVWLALFVLGASLVVWPNLDLYRMDDEHDVLTYIDALYYSGVTATVLGYGDITPLSGWLQVFGFIVSGLGFALLTGVLTYLLNVVSGGTERDGLASRLFAETGRSGSGVKAIGRYMTYQDADALAVRLQALADHVHGVQEKMHQFPILDLFYRSKNPAQDPELIIRSTAEMALAAQLLAQDEDKQQLVPAAEDLGQGALNIMLLIADQYLGPDVVEQLHQASAVEEDDREVARIASLLSEHLSQAPDAYAGSPAALKLATQLRVFFDALEPFTGWSLDSDAFASRADGPTA